jgi:hypothetical protein
MACAAADVVVLYDTSGSVKWNERWRQVVGDANKAIEDLIWTGRLSDPDTWIVMEAPDINSKMAENQSILKAEDDDVLLMIYFDEPASCQSPFFLQERNQVRLFRIGDTDIGSPLVRFLPSYLSRKGKYTYLSLAKSAGTIHIAKNSLHKEKPYFMIVASDMEEDMRGRCSGSSEITRYINSFDVYYDNDVLLSALHRSPVMEGKQKGKTFAVQISLVTRKPAKKIVEIKKQQPEKAKRVPDPYEEEIPPLAEDVLGDIEEPEELNIEPELMENLDDPFEEEKSSGGWVWYALGAAALAGGGLAGAQYMSAARRRKSP